MGIGIGVLLIGFDQPLVLIVISACVGGLMMFIYSGLLILINRKILPSELRIRGGRTAVPRLVDRTVRNAVRPYDPAAVQGPRRRVRIRAVQPMASLRKGRD